MKYFAYGMNTNLIQMGLRCPGAVCLGPAWINDYRLVFRYYADVEPAVDNYCDGVLWEITEDNLRALDALEGYPYHYTRFSVLAHTDRRSDTALVYQMVDQSFEQAPINQYFGMLLEGYDQNSVPAEQLMSNMELV
jgi:gamma-glutamylcyclotransferase